MDPGPAFMKLPALASRFVRRLMLATISRIEMLDGVQQVYCTPRMTA